jgi:cytochrome c peroxidase
MTPAGRLNAPGLISLANALATRYERNGELPDLDEAIGLYRRAAGSAPFDYMSRATSLANLGLALRIRFGHNGVAADLNEAIATLRDAVAVPRDLLQISGLRPTVSSGDLAERSGVLP